jgi:hypothetical protein
MTQKQIIKVSKSEIGDFRIPNYIIKSGCMLRFWVQKPSINENSHGVNELMKFVKSELEHKYGLTIHSFEIPFKKSFRYWFKSYKVIDFINDWNLEEDKIIFNKFNLRMHHKIQSLGHKNLKLLALLKLFSHNGICVFDFYGIGPLGEEHLTNFIESKLTEEQTVLAFDDLNYKPQIIQASKNIIHIDIKRVI